MDKVDLGGHEDKFVETAVFEMDFAEPTENVDMEKPSLFADFADGGLFGGLAWLDVTLRNSPAIFGILNKKNLNIATVGSESKNNAASGRFADNLLDDRLFAEDGLLDFANRGRFVLFRKGFRNFKIVPLPLERRTARRQTLCRGRLRWSFGRSCHEFFLWTHQNYRL